MLQQHSSRTHHVGKRHHRSFTLRMHKHLSSRMLLLQSYYLLCREALMHVASAVPQQHVSSRHTVDIRAEVVVRTEDQLLVLREGVNDLLCVSARHHHIRQRLHRRRGVNIAHHLISRMLLLEFLQVFSLA